MSLVELIQWKDQYPLMLNQIKDALNQNYLSNSTLALDASSASRLELYGEGEAKACFPVAAFSQSAIAAAVAEIQALRDQCWGAQSAAVVNRELSAAWCLHSLRAVGWSLPASWDEYAGDYQCKDGWIRLHTNAPHHREAALKVLGNPLSLAMAREAVFEWEGLELESDVVAEGGASAFMMSSNQWSDHMQGQAISNEPLVSWSETLQKGSSLDSAFKHSESPLKGIRVLDLTRVLAGPVCTRFLASFGADVLRIDPPHWEEGGNVLEMTVGKRCASLDLTLADDKATFETLLSDADVIVHGYRRDALEGLGLGDESRHRINPNLIDVALNAYGWTGPWKNRRGFDSLVQMSAGIAEQGKRSFGADKPVPLPYQALDHVTGYLMAAAVVRAIREKANSGRTLSARLSLARHAKLLQDLSSGIEVPGASNYFDDTLEPITDTHFHTQLESTPWGDIKRLKLPYELEGVELGFAHPVSRLRTSPAAW